MMAINVENGENSDTESGNDVPSKKVLVLGLNGSGKSSILAALAQLESSDPVEDIVPTQGFNIVSIETGESGLNIWEIGGQDNMRPYWKNFTQDTDVLMFVLDSSDKDRMDLASQELKSLLNSNKADLSGKPLVLVANKQDLPEALSPSVMLDQFKSLIADIELVISPTQVSPNCSPVGICELHAVLHKLVTT